MQTYSTNVLWQLFHGKISNVHWATTFNKLFAQNKYVSSYNTRQLPKYIGKVICMWGFKLHLKQVGVIKPIQEQLVIKSVEILLQKIFRSILLCITFRIVGGFADIVLPQISQELCSHTFILKLYEDVLSLQYKCSQFIYTIQK